MKKQKTRCRRGHRLTPENIYMRKDGYRQCRDCMLLADKRYHRRRQFRMKVRKAIDA